MKPKAPREEITRVYRLQGELRAIIVVQPGVPGHWENVEGVWAGNPAPEFDRREWVEEIAPKTIPNEEIRLAAKASLQQIYDSVEYPELKILAGRALGYLKLTWMPFWLESLFIRLRS